MRILGRGSWEKNAPEIQSLSGRGKDEEGLYVCPIGKEKERGTSFPITCSP